MWRCLLLLAVRTVSGDVYLHNPRGSNNKCLAELFKREMKRNAMK